MSYLQDRRNKKKKTGLWVGGIALFLILLFFRTGIFGGFSFVARETFRPVLGGGNAFGVKFSNLGAYFVSKKSLNAQNEILSSRLADAEARMSLNDSLRSENTILKEILGRTEEDDVLVLGAILSKPNVSAYDTLLIDAGSDEGIRAGDLALARGYIPIGRVESVTPNTAKVILFSSGGESTPSVLVSREPGTPEEKNLLYELIGRGGGNFELVLPRELKFDVGDTAVLPGIDSGVIARAESVISDPRDPFKKILLASPANFQHLNFVQIEIK